jgi:rhodanese-related sulfurtransferase
MFGLSKKEKFNNLTPQKSYKFIKENENNPQFILLDVRTPVEFLEVHLEGAKLLDYNGGDFFKELDNLDKAKIYLLYCRTGVRSGNGKKLMDKSGFSNVYNMLGGINRWIQEEFPTICSNRCK